MYAKLFQDILNSSLWEEDSDTRIVWITLLAMADKDGMVRATARAVARQAIIEPGITDRALEKFQRPDPLSRNPDNEGRRIERVPGGYLILNFAAYAKLASRADQREKTRERVERHRERKKERCNAPVTPCNGVTPVDVDVDVAVTEDVKDTPADNAAESKAPLSTPEVSKTGKYGGPVTPSATGKQPEFKEVGTPSKPSVSVRLSDDWIAEFVAWWRFVADTHGLPSVRRVSAGRRKKITKRLQEWARLPGGARSVWKQLDAAIAASGFLRGKDGGWKITFDWLVKNEDNWTKLLEGAFADGKDSQDMGGIEFGGKKWA